MAGKKYLIVGATLVFLALWLMFSFPGAVQVVASTLLGLAILGMAFLGLVFMMASMEEMKIEYTEGKIMESKVTKKKK